MPTAVGLNNVEWRDRRRGPGRRGSTIDLALPRRAAARASRYPVFDPKDVSADVQRARCGCRTSRRGPRSAPTSIRACASPPACAPSAFARAERDRDPAARRGPGQARRAVEAAAVRGRVPPAARVPVRVPLGDREVRALDADDPRAAVRAARGRARPGLGVLHRSHRADHAMRRWTARSATTAAARPTAASCSRRIAAARGSRWLSYSYSKSTRDRRARRDASGCSRSTSRTA